MAPWDPAPRPPPLGVGEVLVCRLRIEPDTVDAAVLSPAERARMERFVFDRDRLQFAGTRSALRRLLAGLDGADPRALAFTEGPHGKPRLAGPAGARLRFNVSHTGDLALLALALDREVGVDVERHRPEPDVDALAPQVCEGRELAALRALPAAARRAAFYALWAGKEAVLKALGAGLTVSPRRLELPPHPWTARCRVRVEGVAGAEFQACPLDAGPGVSAAVAVEGDAPVALRLIERPAR